MLLLQLYLVAFVGHFSLAISLPQTANFGGTTINRAGNPINGQQPQQTSFNGNAGNPMLVFATSGDQQQQQDPWSGMRQNDNTNGAMMMMDGQKTAGFRRSIPPEVLMGGGGFGMMGAAPGGFGGMPPMRNTFGGLGAAGMAGGFRPSPFGGMGGMGSMGSMGGFGVNPMMGMSGMSGFGVNGMNQWPSSGFNGMNSFGTGMTGVPGMGFNGMSSFGAQQWPTSGFNGLNSFNSGFAGLAGPTGMVGNSALGGFGNTGFNQGFGTAGFGTGFGTTGLNQGFGTTGFGTGFGATGFGTGFGNAGFNTLNNGVNGFSALNTFGSSPSTFLSGGQFPNQFGGNVFGERDNGGNSQKRASSPFSDPTSPYYTQLFQTPSSFGNFEEEREDTSGFGSISASHKRNVQSVSNKAGISSGSPSSSINGSPIRSGSSSL